MTSDAKLRCRCGEVTGKVSDASPSTLNRVICYCSDCQAFAHYLGRADLLDTHGGSDIVQVAPASVTLDRGTMRIAALRLSEKGPYRFYTSCCKTPVGNMAGPAIPFIGIVAQAFEGDARSRDELLGKPTGGIHGQDAVGTAPPGTRKVRPRIMIRAIRLVLGWRLSGRAWPHPYFDRGANAPKYPVKVLSLAEREALRPLCGPRPSATAASIPS
jgi:hypothetical protein